MSEFHMQALIAKANYFCRLCIYIQKSIVISGKAVFAAFQLNSRRIHSLSSIPLL